MESFLNRYRSITVLLLVIFAQLILLAVQVKNDQDVRIIRTWTVTAVTPVARVVDWVRGGSIGFIRNYFLLREAGDENRKLREEVGRLRMENNYLKNELSTAERAKALQVFQARTPSRTLAANVIGIGAGSNSKVVFVNRGSAEGVMRGMAVVTPEGIVGKVIASYPTASEVLLITAPEFAAGVMAQGSQVRGTLKGQGNPLCKIDYIAPEEKVEPGNLFYTSGDDRIFPRGFLVGAVKAVRTGNPYKEILVEPGGLQHGLEDVLILISNVHQDIPEEPVRNQPVYVAPGPPVDDPSAKPAGQVTEADRLRGLYKAAGDAQGHSFGEGTPGSRPPDFTKVGTQTGVAGRGGPNAPAGAGTQTSPVTRPPGSGPGNQPAGVRPPTTLQTPGVGNQGPGAAQPVPGTAHPPASGQGAASGGPAARPGTQVPVVPAPSGPQGGGSQKQAAPPPAGGAARPTPSGQAPGTQVPPAVRPSGDTQGGGSQKQAAPPPAGGAARPAPNGSQGPTEGRRPATGPGAGESGSGAGRGNPR